MATTFFTACNRRYWPFAVPYAVSVLQHNADAVVEIGVEDAADFRAIHGTGLRVVGDHFPDRLLLREVPFAGELPNSVRFLQEPILRSEHTYIGDVDVLILDEEVEALHLRHMGRTGLPYSNVLRPGTRRLTGLHFTRTDAHYPLVVPPDRFKMNDEELLCAIVVAKGLRLPAPDDAYRPVHGIHMSLNRAITKTPDGIPAWGIAPRLVDRYLALRDTDVWRAALQTFSPSYLVLLGMMEAVMQAEAPEVQVCQPGALRSLWSRLEAG